MNAPVASPPRSADWVDQAACGTADPERFFQADEVRSEILREQQAHQLATTARLFCAGCPVIQRCAELADADLLQGLFGGALRFRDSRSRHYAWELLVAGAPIPRPAERPIGVKVGWVA